MTDEAGKLLDGVEITLNVKDELGEEIQNQWVVGRTRGDPPSLIVEGRPMPGAFNPIKKYVVEATASGYEPATVEIPLAEAKWVERSPSYRGFDDSADPPWVVAGSEAGFESMASTLALSETVSDPAEIKIAIAQGAPQIAAITPSEARGTETDTDVKGLAVGETRAEAKKGPDVAAELRVAVYEPRRQAIRFVILSDAGGNRADVMEAQLEVALSDAAKLWKDQAVVELEQLPTIRHKLQNSYPNPISQTQARQALMERGVPRPQQGEFIVYVWWSVDIGPGVAGVSFGPTIFVNSTVSSRILAHEIGHSLGYGGHSGEDESLMNAQGVSGGLRLRKWEADAIPRLPARPWRASLRGTGGLSPRQIRTMEDEYVFVVSTRCVAGMPGSGKSVLGRGG